MSKKKYWVLAAILAIPVTYYSYALAAWSFERHTVAGNQIYELYSDGTVTIAGPLKSGNNYTGASVTRPTITTGSQFAHWVPVYNVGTSAVTKGTLLISSAAGAGYVEQGTATNDLVTVVGAAAEGIASGAVGWMIPCGGGYALLKTTGTVAIGNTLSSTAAAAGFFGYDATPTAGSVTAVALSTTSIEALVLAIMK